jgi:hypothetical protein
LAQLESLNSVDVEGRVRVDSGESTRD